MNKEAYQLMLDRKVGDTKNFLVKSTGPNRQQRRIDKKINKLGKPVKELQFIDEYCYGTY